MIGKYTFYECSSLTTFNVGVQKLEEKKEAKGKTMYFEEDEKNINMVI